MSTRLAGIIKVSIPHIREVLNALPASCRHEDFLRAWRRELCYCISRALQAQEGAVVFSDLQVPFEGHEKDGQYIVTFEVFDRSKPRENAYNFHGQNVSQWTYAGCILYQDGKVSTHH